ncbi:DUF6886 family protein [Actinoplanes sp. NPDC051633]|uniref:DUF6886 family protein n=1 Tax=Actinoplanes sp. NPDC051633 TaxID=3155670 RepID=UPI00343CD91B
MEHAWVARIEDATLFVHELDPAGFTVIDEIAGYWVSGQDATVTAVRRVHDGFAAFAEHDVELRLACSLWPYMDAVVAAGGEFSGIRMRNARPAEPGPTSTQR